MSRVVNLLGLLSQEVRPSAILTTVVSTIGTHLVISADRGQMSGARMG